MRSIKFLFLVISLLSLGVMTAAAQDTPHQHHALLWRLHG
jgi:hypothetical protein